MAMAAGYRQIHEFERSLDRKLDELENLLRALATGRENPIAPIQGGGQIQSCDEVHSGIKNQGVHRGNEHDPTLLVKIHLEYYVISSDVLNQVFSRIGELETIERLNQEFHFQWRIRFRNRGLAFKAFECFDGRCIYDDCCRMELLIDRTTSEAIKMAVPIEAAIQTKEMKSMDDKLEQPTEDMRNLWSEDRSTLSMDPDQNWCYRKMEPMSQIQPCALEVLDGIPNFQCDVVQAITSDLEQENCDQSSSLENTENWDAKSDRDAVFEFQVSTSNQFREEHVEDNMEVNSKPLEVVVFNVAPEKIEAFDELIGSLEVRLCDMKASSLEFLAIPTAQEVFDERPERGFNGIDFSVQVGSVQMQMGNWVFDPGSTKDQNNKYNRLNQRHLESFYAVVFDGNSQETVVSIQSSVDVNAYENDCFGASLKGSLNRIDSVRASNCIITNGESILLPFDRGKPVCVLGLVEVQGAKKRQKWDPGGSVQWRILHTSGPD